MLHMFCNFDCFCPILFLRSIQTFIFPSKLLLIVIFTHFFLSDISSFSHNTICLFFSLLGICVVFSVLLLQGWMFFVPPRVQLLGGRVYTSSTSLVFFTKLFCKVVGLTYPPVFLFIEHSCQLLVPYNILIFANLLVSHWGYNLHFTD